MCYGRSELPGVQFLSERVERLRSFAEEIDVEDGFGVRQVQASEIGV